MDGAPESVVGEFLIALKIKTAEAAELAGGVRAMLKRARPLNLRDREVLDTCGTGGDGAGTVNISTGAASVGAAAGAAAAPRGRTRDGGERAKARGGGRRSGCQPDARAR